MFLYFNICNFFLEEVEGARGHGLHCPVEAKEVHRHLRHLRLILHHLNLFVVLWAIYLHFNYFCDFIWHVSGIG